MPHWFCIERNQAMIAVVNSGVANVRSVVNALDAIGAEGVITDQPRDIRDARAIILPGVGAFADGMKNLRERGLTDVLAEQVLDRGKPMLGICLGMQLLTQTGFEHGEHAGLGWLAGTTQPFELDDPALRVTHVGLE